MRTHDKVTVVVPAWNEEDRIGDILPEVRKWQGMDAHNRHVVVVSDGSTDRTVEIAKRHGFDVLHSNPNDPHMNMGKAAAVKRGLMHAKKMGSNYLVTLDADLAMLKHHDIDCLLDELKHSGRDMIIARTTEGMDISTYESGQRAFKVCALEPWLAGNRAWDDLLVGYGLEAGLNHLIPDSGFARMFFKAHPSFRKGGKRQREEVERTKGLIGEKARAAKMRHDACSIKGFKR